MFETKDDKIKTSREYLCKLIESNGDAIAKVKTYIMSHVDLESGLYFGSLNDTSDATKTSRSTVARVFKCLQKDDLIRLYQNGVWAINPNLLMKGNSIKYKELWGIYSSLPSKQN